MIPEISFLGKVKTTIRPWSALLGTSGSTLVLFLFIFPSSPSSFSASSFLSLFPSSFFFFFNKQFSPSDQTVNPTERCDKKFRCVNCADLKKKAQCESCKLSSICGKMRTISWETAFQRALRNCSRELGGKVSKYVILAKGST